MSDSRFLKLAVGWAVAGVVLAIVKTVMTEGHTAAEFTLYELVPFTAGLLVLSGLHFFLKRPSYDGCSESGELTDGMKLEVERDKLVQERAELNRLQKEIEQQLDQRAEQLNSREVALTNRLVQFHEWEEYPKPDEVSRRGTAPALLIEQDQQVMELLDKEARLVYSRLKDGYYNPDGRLDPVLVRDQVIDLVTRVAKVYRPDAQNPLMETSVDQMLRAGSRVCLHLLIVLDRLPLNLHEETLSTIHAYVRNAIKAWETYSAAEPYLNQVGRAWYVGRYLAGASPLTMGITWALTELGKHGAKAIGRKVVDQQAVALIGDVVRIVGFEVASVFSGDFRHRSADWVYGSELTNLMSRYPVSRENLAHALREVGRLSMRNEYDRIFLYRCLSAHRAAAPLINAQDSLPPVERQQIAQQLQKFYDDFIHGRTKKRLDSWLDGVEERLGVRLDISIAEKGGKAIDVATADTDSVMVIESLAGFVTAVKGRPVSELTAVLPQLESAKIIGKETCQQILNEVEATPPQLFEPPDIDPDSSHLQAYLNDLVWLSVEVAPHDLQPDDFVSETAAYFGVDVKTIQKQLDQKYCEFITERLPEEAPSVKPSAVAARMLVSLLEENDTPKFVYGNVKVLSLSGTNEGALMATQDRLLLVSTGEQPWTATASLTGPALFSAEKIDGMVLDDCRLVGHWQMTSPENPDGAESLSDDSGVRLEVTIPGAVMNRFDKWFRPILQISRSEWVK